MPTDLPALCAMHRAALDEFVARAGALSATQWLTPRAEGKWTPAQEARHLILAYEAITRDILEGKTMRLRGTPWKRRLWRVVGLGFIALRRRLPRGVSAPREVRPDWEATPAPELLALLQQRAVAFEEAALRTLRHHPDRAFMHPMLGPLSLPYSLKFCAMHLRHHAGFLPVATATVADNLRA